MNTGFKIAIAALVAAQLGACAEQAEPVKQPRPVVVEHAKPLSGPGGADSYPGSVRSRIEADLSFRVGGKILSREVEVGQPVKKGELLAVLDPDDMKLALSASRAALEAAKADLWLAQEEEKRYMELRSRGHIGQSAVDARINSRRLAEARMKQAQSELNLAKNQSAYTRLTAERDGLVTEVLAEVGNVVSPGQPIVRLAADGEREVVINISESRLAAVRAAEGVAIYLLEHPDAQYLGRVREINPQADSTTRTHEARVTILEPDDKVELGASAAVLVLSAAPDNSYRLPATALGDLPPDRAVVWAVVSNGHSTPVAKPVDIKVLSFTNDSVIFTAEIEPDTQLVSAGVQLLVEGMEVRPIMRSAPAAL